MTNPTKLHINEGTLKSTDRCLKNFACLKDRECLCEISQCTNGNDLVIKYERNKPCKYKVSMGNTILCSCPTRKELYGRYNI